MENLILPNSMNTGRTTALKSKKARNGLPDDLWETYSAFANSNGGCIILGVKEHDDKSWYTTGLKDVGKLKKSFWDTIHNHKNVSVVLLTDDDLKDYEINFEVIVPRGILIFYQNSGGHHDTVYQRMCAAEVPDKRAC